MPFPVTDKFFHKYHRFRSNIRDIGITALAGEEAYSKDRFYIYGGKTSRCLHRAA